MESDRGPWTSASNAEADSLCAARHLRQRGIPEEPSKYAESGTRVHDWLAGKPASAPLAAAELDVAEQALQIERQLIADHFGLVVFGLELPGEIECAPGIQIFREKRFWMHWETAALGNRQRISHSGQVDLLVVSGNRAFLSERKSLWGNVAESPRNLQVRDQVVLAQMNLPSVTEVYAIVNQPRVTRKPEVALYTMYDFAQALSALERRVEASNDLNARANPSEKACKFCRAKRICPEFLSSSLPIAFHTVEPYPTEAFLADVIAKLPGKRLGAGLGMARLLAEAFEAETRARLARGEDVEGWRMAPGRVTEKIVDAQKVFGRFIALGGATNDFMPAVTVGKGKLENALRGLNGARGQGLKAEMQRLLEGATESKRSAEILERV